MSVTEVHREIRCDLRQTHDTSAMTEGYTTKPNDVILRRLAKCDENYISPEMDCAAVERGGGGGGGGVLGSTF